MLFSKRKEVEEQYLEWLESLEVSEGMNLGIGYKPKDCASTFIIWLQTTSDGEEVVKKLYKELEEEADRKLEIIRAIFKKILGRTYV